MTTIDKESVLTISRARSLYGESGLTRGELAELAGTSERLVAALESCRALPAFMEGLIRIGAALQVPLDDLIDTSLLRRIRSGVAYRRRQREGEPADIGFRCRDHDGR